MATYRVTIEEIHNGKPIQTHTFEDSDAESAEALAFASARALRGMCDDEGHILLDSVICKLIIQSRFSLWDEGSRDALFTVAKAYEDWDGGGSFNDLVKVERRVETPA